MMIVRRLSFIGGGGMKCNRKDGAGIASTSRGSGGVDQEQEERGAEWELRPGGMLVQKRQEGGAAAAAATAHLIRVRIAFGATRFQISVNSQASFGELKKLLTAECGLQHWEQRLLYRGRERENKEFLDICGVKDGSKLILVEDPCSREKRMIDIRKNNQIQCTIGVLQQISADVDVLADQVSAIEKSISQGVKVAEVRISTLLEMLMIKAVKLDSIPTAGDTSALRNLQSKRVRKCVETLDLLKMSNANIKPIVVTTKWETFDPPISTTPLNLLD